MGSGRTAYSSGKVHVYNFCQECGAEAYPITINKSHGKAKWQCKVNEAHLFPIRKYEVGGAKKNV